jgi:hypothetical protein
VNRRRGKGGRSHDSEIESGYEHVKQLVKEGHAVFKGHDAWSEHETNAKQENDFENPAAHLRGMIEEEARPH